jgi:ribosomal-protein-alanine N-acetyltransferase
VLLASGTRVGLREIAAADVTERYVGWLNDPVTAQFLESRFALHTIESVGDFVAQQLADPAVLMLAIVELDGGAHVGNIKVGPLSPHHGTADVGLLIGERAVWGRGYGTEAIRLATQLGFERLGARKLTASCYSDNAGSAAAFRRAGWTDEGVRPAQFVGAGGGVQDQVMFGVLAP